MLTAEYDAGAPACRATPSPGRSASASPTSPRRPSASWPRPRCSRAGCGRRGRCSAAASSSPTRSGRRTSPSGPRRRSPTSPPSTIRRRRSTSSARSSRRRGGSGDARSRSTRSATSPRTSAGRATGTGSLGELEAARQYELDDAGEIVLDHGIAMLRIMRGEVSDEAVEELVPAGSRPSRTATSRPGSSTSWASRRSRVASSATAADEWTQGRRDERLQRALHPAAGRGGVGSSPGARMARPRRSGALVARGTRGRSIDADRLTVEAGIAALAGDREGGARRVSDRASRRTGTCRFRSTRRSSRSRPPRRSVPQDPEVAGWVDGGRAILIRLRATPLLELLDRAGREPTARGRPRRDGDRRCRGVTVRLTGSRQGRAWSPGITSRPRVSITCGSETSRALKITCCAPASDELPEPVDDLRRRVARPVVGLELHGLERRALDLRRVAADRLAVLAQDLVLVVDPDRVAEHVARVGVLGHEAERLPLAAAADHDRRVGPRDRLRRVEQAARVDVACPRTPPPVPALAVPHRVDVAQRVLELLEPLGRAAGTRTRGRVTPPRSRRRRCPATHGRRTARRASSSPSTHSAGWR